MTITRIAGAILNKKHAHARRQLYTVEQATVVTLEAVRRFRTQPQQCMVRSTPPHAHTHTELTHKQPKA